MCFSASDHIVVRFILLEHRPHGDHVVLGVAPVALRIEVAVIQLFCQPELYPCHMRRNFSRYEFFPTPRALMIEQNAARCMQVIGLSIIPREMITGDLRNSVRRARMKRCLFALRRYRRFTEHFARGSEIKTST